MTYRSGFRALAGLVAAALIPTVWSCDGLPPEALQVGELRVATLTSGGDPDRDGFRVFVDSVASDSLGTAAATMIYVTTGVHLVELRGVAPNCTVTGDNPRSVTIVRGESADETFDVRCVATGIQVNVTTTGLDPDPDGYLIKVDSGPAIQVAAGNSSQSFTYLAAGLHTVTLSGNAANCPVASGNSRSLSLTTGVIAVESVSVACVAATGVLEVTAVTTGIDLDADGYSIQVDGGASLPLGINASLAFTGLAPGDHGLTVSGASSNCTISSSSPPIVTITAGKVTRDTTHVTLTVSCKSVTGAISVSASGTGLDVDSALTLFLDGGFPQQFRMGTPVTFSGIGGGAHSIQLADVAGNCAVVGDNPQNVQVTTGRATRDTVLAAFSLSCAVTTGVVQVTIVTTGGDPDADGYSAGLLDIGRYETVASNGTRTMSGVPLGKHFLGLGNAAANCSVAAPNPREVTVTAGVTAPDTTKVTFTVSCVAFTGAVRATVTTSGIDPDPDGYQVQLVGLFHTAWLSLPSNGTALVDRLPPGVYVVRPIDGAALNCAAGGNPASITVAVGDTAALALAVDCAPAAQLAIGVANGATRTDIYSLKSNGAALVQLTSDAADERDPAWSFDGTRIAFVSDKPGNDEIYVMNADGTGQTRLTNEAQPDGHPTWSPNGTQIAFASHRSGNTDIWVMNADGSNPVRLTTNAAEDMDPAWSPDGTRIAFVSNRDGNLEVYVMNADGSNQTRITQTAVDETQPDWSPNGSQLVVSRFTHCDYYYGCDYDLVVMNADGSNQVTLPSTSIDVTPAWSPDGQWIAFGAGYCDYYYGCYSIGVWAIRPNGTGQTQIAPSGSKPTWRH